MIKRFFILFGAFAISVAVYNAFFSIKDWYGKEKFIPPVFYADGSVEYTLATRQMFTEQNGKRIYPKPWSVRIPDLIQCTIQSKNGVCSKYEPKALIPKYLVPENNLLLLIKFTYPDFNVLNDAERNDDLLFNRRRLPDLVTLQLGADHMEYKERSANNTGKYTFIEQFEKGIDASCAKETEVFPGLFRMRDLTTEEKQKKRVRPDRYCIPKTPDGIIKFVYFKAPEQPIADGACNTTKLAERCNFTIWLKQNRYATLNFDRSHLSDFKTLYDDVNSYVDKLVEHSSSNLSKTEVKQ